MNNERELRESIRSVVKAVKKKRLNEEKDLRIIIQKMIDHELYSLNERQVSDVDPSPNKSTGINVLEDLLKNIITVLETDYKIMTTSEEQRKSFRSHVVNAIVNTLKPVEINNDATAVNEDIEIELGDEEDPDQDKFIDLRSDAEKKADEKPEDPLADFGIEGEDETGRNMAYNSFKKIETSVVNSYELLSAEEDKELFHDYLIANVKLYFDKFETELAGTVEEPTNQAYNTASSGEDNLEEPTDDEIDLGL